MNTLDSLLERIRACHVCAQHLPREPRPILRAHPAARVLIVGQAPGIRVHETGIPWNDPSGQRLRQWLDVAYDTFYDVAHFAIIPMGYCYPGTGPSGDYPPRAECAQLWLPALLNYLPNIRLTLLVGQYAQAHYLGKRRKKNLTSTVQAYQEYLPRYFPLPHPSPRNNRWLFKNPWFLKTTIPQLKTICHAVLKQGQLKAD